MKKVLMIGALLTMCAGCVTGVQEQSGGEKKTGGRKDRVVKCSHTDQPIYKFENFPDGHHFLFGSDGKLLASVNTKDGVLCGEFEVYYYTGNREYWGVLDAGGHIIIGKHNSYAYSEERHFNVREMTVADKQNVQSRLEEIMRTGIDKMNEKQTASKVEISRDKAKQLIDYSQAGGHPVVGETYIHNGEELQVFQVFDEGVLVRNKSSISPVLTNMYGYLDIVVETTEKYVDDEMLMPGKYMYMGPWTYTTVEKKERTIRRFKQVE